MYESCEPGFYNELSYSDIRVPRRICRRRPLGLPALPIESLHGSFTDFPGVRAASRQRSLGLWNMPHTEPRN
jgi:hypothetical protein